MEVLYMETPNDELEAYAKERCDEMNNIYDDLNVRIMALSNETDELEKLNILQDITSLIKNISCEHIDTLDRYLWAYEYNKRLENKITKLEHPNDYMEE